MRIYSRKHKPSWAPKGVRTHHRGNWEKVVTRRRDRKQVRVQLKNEVE
jgi:hypothetical protein